MRHQWALAIAVVLGGVVGWAAAAVPCAAQTAAGQAQGGQSSGGGAAGTTPSSGTQSTAVQSTGTQIPGTTPSSTPTPSIGQRTGPRNLFASSPVAGRGLPGMPGGPPVNAPMGARDPSDSYMLPRALGLLSCDMAVNPDCLMLF